MRITRRRVHDDPASGRPRAVGPLWCSGQHFEETPRAASSRTSSIPGDGSSTKVHLKWCGAAPLRLHGSSENPDGSGIERAGRGANGASGATHNSELMPVLISTLAGPGGLNALPAGIAKALESARGENSGWRPPPQPGLHSGTAPWGPSFWG